MWQYLHRVRGGLHGSTRVWEKGCTHQTDVAVSSDDRRHSEDKNVEERRIRMNEE
jgi:hypothetical protein